MNLIELLREIKFPPNVKFVSQDEDGLINMYHSDPEQRHVLQYWTCQYFLKYLEDSDGEDIYLPVADDFRTALLSVEDGKVVGATKAIPDTDADVGSKKPAEFKIKLCQEGFDYMMDGMEIAELTVGIVNHILKEQGVDIVFEVEDRSDEE